MEVLKTKVKREMALIKVIDLTKTDVIPSVVPQLEAQKGGESNAPVTDKINYLLLKAKD